MRSTELADESGFRSAADAAAAVQLVKKRLLVLLRQTIAEITAGESEADEYDRVVALLGA